MINSHASTTRRFFDWLLIRLSRSTRIDGLWVGVFSEDRDTEILRRVGEALRLIKTYDRYRYRRVLEEIERLWVHLLPNSVAAFVPGLRRCLVDPRFVLASPPELIASAIVHEATHGRLIRYNIGYSEDLRHRVEKVCMRQERAFALKIPHGEELRQMIERELQLAPELWADEAVSARHRVGEVAMARYGGLPDWLIRALLGFRKKIAGSRH